MFLKFKNPALNSVRVFEVSNLQNGKFKKTEKVKIAGGTKLQRPRSAAHININSYASTQSRPIPVNFLLGLGGSWICGDRGELVIPILKNTQSSLLTSCNSLYPLSKVSSLKITRLTKSS